MPFTHTHTLPYHYNPQRHENTYKKHPHRCETLEEKNKNKQQETVTLKPGTNRTDDKIERLLFVTIIAFVKQQTALHTHTQYVSLIFD